jgi:hypothetical protein
LKRSLPSENFYPGISLYYDLRYGPEGEYNILKRLLEEQGLATEDKSVSKALSASQQIYKILQERCKAEIKELENYAEDQFVVGGVPAALVWLSHTILKLGLQAKEAGTSISLVFKPKNKEDELIAAVIKKLEEDKDAEEIVVRKVSEITIKTKRRGKSRSEKKRGKKN